MKQFSLFVLLVLSVFSIVVSCKGPAVPTLNEVKEMAGGAQEAVKDDKSAKTGIMGSGAAVSSGKTVTPTEVTITIDGDDNLHKTLTNFKINGHEVTIAKNPSTGNLSPVFSIGASTVSQIKIDLGKKISIIDLKEKGNAIAEPNFDSSSTTDTITSDHNKLKISLDGTTPVFTFFKSDGRTILSLFK